MEIRGQDFGEALESDHNTFIGTPFDGVFGLAFPELAKPGTISPLQRLCSEGLLPKCLFSVWLTDCNQSYGGELQLGEIEENAYLGELHWVPVSNRPYWQFDVKCVWFEGQEHNLAEDIQALLHTGSSTISVPPYYIQDVDSTLGVKEYMNGYGLLSCNSLSTLPRFNLQIKGKV